MQSEAVVAMGGRRKRREGEGKREEGNREMKEKEGKGRGGRGVKGGRGRARMVISRVSQLSFI